MSRQMLGVVCILLCGVAGALPFSGFGDFAQAKGFNANSHGAAIIRRTNEYRKKNRLGAVRVDARLRRAAQRYANYYAANPGRPSLWGHEYGGLNPMDRAENAGFDGRCVGENLAWHGTSGALSSLGSIDQAAMDGWIKSRLHRKNLEHRDFDVIGVGSARFRVDGKQWIVTVQMFGCSQPMPKGPGGMRFN